MMSARLGFIVAALASATSAVAGDATATADPPPKPTYAINLGGRSGCVTPSQSCQARADGGATDVTVTLNALTATFTGTVAANAHLGSTGSACETFHLAQEFEITCTDPKVKTVSLTLESSLVGFVFSRHKAGAQMRVAAATVTPLNWQNSPVSVAHPVQAVGGREGHLCNQHLPPLTVPEMPVGRYVLNADFVIDAVASGLADGHAVADFSPGTTLPADWVRTRDPFQGVDKKNFGFTLTLTAAPNDDPVKVAARARVVSPEVVKASVNLPARRKPAAPARAAAHVKGYELLLQR